MSLISPADCQMCQGTGHSSNTYVAGAGSWQFHTCPRCDGSGHEPNRPTLHPGLLMRNKRSGKVWAIYSAYDGGANWGIHRFKLARGGGHYVWQILMRTPEQLLGPAWEPVGCGDAWEQNKREQAGV